MMLFITVSVVQMPVVFVIISECLGALWIFAGVALWRGKTLGLRMSRVLQAVQVIRIYSGPLVFVLAIGPQILINLFFGHGFSITTHTSAPIPVSQFLEFSAAFTLLGGGDWAKIAPIGIGINLFAALAFAALIKSRLPPTTDGPQEPLPPR